MSKIPFGKARFVKTAVEASGYAVVKGTSGQPLPEIAVAGRSNVGKSSLLNDLFQQKGLVKTSGTPGKTQALNFFQVEDRLMFVDLPGYGYAQVPTAVRKQWGPMVHGYLMNRPQLQLILFLFDIRRKPNSEDLEFMEWIAQSQKGVILVLTKVDKLTPSERALQKALILKAFDTENLHTIQYSTSKKIGRYDLIRLICEAMGQQKESEDDDAAE